MEYGHIENGNLVRAPRTYRDGDTYNLTPTEADHLAHGNRRIVSSAPTARDGHHIVADGWRETDTTVERVWREVEDEPTYRCWTPLTIMRAAKTAGVWTAIKTALDGADAYDEFMASGYVAECDVAFVGVRSVLVAAIGEPAAAEFVDGLKVERRGTRADLCGDADDTEEE